MQTPEYIVVSLGGSLIAPLAGIDWRFLKKFPGGKIIYDLRASDVVPDTVHLLGGRPLINRVGHAFIKRRMIEEGAVFAGEVTGHYYFKNFFRVF